MLSNLQFHEFLKQATQQSKRINIRVIICSSEPFNTLDHAIPQRYITWRTTPLKKNVKFGVIKIMRAKRITNFSDYHIGNVSFRHFWIVALDNLQVPSRLATH